MGSKESWFTSIWRASRRNMVLEPEKTLIGILSFEVARMMSKIVNLWECLSDKQMNRLREDLVSSLGIQKVVSDDDDHLMDLALAEIVENLKCVAKSTARLGKRCVDTAYHNLDDVFDDPVEIDLYWRGWDYRLKKMERKVKKMERFAAVTSQLYQELEVLAELEHTLRRMQANANASQVKLHEFHQKVLWQRQEVASLREMSPWIRTYDYTVRLLLRSLFTIVERIKYVFGISQIGSAEGSDDSDTVNSSCLLRSNSISALMQSSVHPSENSVPRFSKLHSGPLGRSISNIGLANDKNLLKNRKLQVCYQSSILCGAGKHPPPKSKRLAHIGPFKGCRTSGVDSPILEGCMPGRSTSLRLNRVFRNDMDYLKTSHMLQPKDSSGLNIGHAMSLLNSKHKLLNVQSSTLGNAALALHYANVIILIEKLSSSPHFISPHARGDLYDMLTASIKNAFRAKLTLFSKTLSSAIYDPALASEWNSVLRRILEWLAPLAHNMIRWHSERNFEKQQMISGGNVLLVQTLYFANQAKTEAAITELLMGLHYISRFGREINDKAFLSSTCGRACDDHLLHKGKMSHDLIHNTLS